MAHNVTAMQARCPWLAHHADRRIFCGGIDQDEVKETGDPRMRNIYGPWGQYITKYHIVELPLLTGTEKPLTYNANIQKVADSRPYSLHFRTLSELYDDKNTVRHNSKCLKYLKMTLGGVLSPF